MLLFMVLSFKVTAQTESEVVPCDHCFEPAMVRAPFGDLADAMKEATDYTFALELLGDYDCTGWDSTKQFSREDGAMKWVQGHVIWWRRLRHTSGNSCVIHRPGTDIDGNPLAWEPLNFTEAVILTEAVFHWFDTPSSESSTQLPE
jgi:hypothetical protein